MTRTYNPISVIVDMYPTIWDNVIPKDTEIGKIIVYGGREPYSFEIIDKEGNPLSIYTIVEDKIFTTEDIDLSKLKPFKVRVTESSVMTLSIDSEHDALGERVPETTSFASTPSIKAAASIQDLFTKTNMIYKITREYDLAGTTLTIPNGSTLDFQGGKFKNGVLAGCINIKDCNYKIFDNISFAKSKYIPYMKPEYFGAIGNGVQDTSSYINTMFAELINGSPTANPFSSNTTGDTTYIDLQGTKIIFSGLYAVKNPIVISSPVYGLSIENLNLVSKAATANESPMFRFQDSVCSAKFINCNLDGNYTMNGIQANGNNVREVTFDKCRISKFYSIGLDLYPVTYGWQNKITNCTIYQEYAGNNTPTAILTDSIGILTYNLEYTVVDNSYIGPCKGMPISNLGIYPTITNCKFSGLNTVESDRMVDITGFTNDTIYACITNCDFEDCHLKVGGLSKVEGCTFRSKKFEGKDYIYLKHSSEAGKAQHQYTLIRNNLFVNNGSIATSGSPIMAMDAAENISAISFPVSIIDNRYQNMLTQDPKLSDVVQDAIIKLVSGGGVIWSNMDAAPYEFSALQVGNVLIHWCSSILPGVREQKFLRDYKNTYYQVFIIPNDSTGGSTMIKQSFTKTSKSSMSVNLSTDSFIFVIGEASVEA